MQSLPLTLFEQYLFFEDRSGYPSRIVQEFRFKGSVNREFLEESVREVASKHPLLTALVDDRSFRSPRWQINGSKTLPIHWHRRCALSFKPVLRRFDITREAAAELHVVEGSDRWNLLLNISHAICDGVASCSLIHDILLVYDNKFQKKHPIRTPNPKLLPKRNHFGLSLRKKVALMPAQITGLILAFTLVRRKISPLVPSPHSRANQTRSENGQFIVSKKLEPIRYNLLKELAENQSKSVNDCCLAFLHAAIGVWRKRKGVDSPKDWIRISVPKNLRSESDRNLPACNALSIAPIDRQSRGLSNRRRLLQRAHEDMVFVKKGMLSLTFLAVLWIHRLRPKGIQRMCRRNICRTTAVLSNIGRVFKNSPLLDANQKLQVHNAILESVITAAPIRPQTNATLFLSEYAKELRMDLNYDPVSLNESDAEELLDDFIAEIDGTLEEQGPRSRES